MYRKIILFSAITFLFSNSQSIQDGIDFYNKRGDDNAYLVPSSENIDKAISIFESLLSSKDDQEAGTYLIKSYYYMAQYISQEKNEKIFYFNLAMTKAKEYIYKYPESVEPLYWYLASMSNWAKTVGLRSITKMGGGDEFRDKAVDVIVLDSDYEDGGGYFLLGAVYFTAPYIPLISTWPDNTKAIKYFKKAVETGLATPLQQVYLAKALIKENLIDEARKILINISKMNSRPYNFIEDSTYIEEAKMLLIDLPS
jgi:TPR repeat protein